MGKCDICYKELKGYGCRGIISWDENERAITRMCDECYEEVGKQY